MVWVSFLKRLKVSSFKRSARMIGAGKPHTRSIRLRTRVFLRAVMKALVLNAFSNQSNPTHGTLHNGWMMLFFLKARAIHCMG